MKSVVASVALVASTQAFVPTIPPQARNILGAGVLPTYQPNLLSGLRTGAEELRTVGTQFGEAATGTGQVLGETYNPSNLAQVGRDQAANARNFDFQQLGQGLRTDAEAWQTTGQNLPQQLPAAGETLGEAFVAGGQRGYAAMPTAGAAFESELRKRAAQFATVAPVLREEGQDYYQATETLVPRAAGLFQAGIAGSPTFIPKAASVFQNLAQRADREAPTAVPAFTAKLAEGISNPAKAARQAEREARKAARAAKRAYTGEN